MARKKFSGGEEGSAEIAMGPMIDCVFLLLLYFVCVSTIDDVRISKEVELPIAKDGILEEDESGRFLIDIEWDEADYSPTYKVGAHTLYHVGEIAEYIQRVRRRPSNFRVVVRADRRVPYEFTQEVMAVVAHSGIANLMFSTKEVE